MDGDDPSILYGDDINLNHVMDANESFGRPVQSRHFGICDGVQP